MSQCLCCNDHIPNGHRFCSSCAEAGCGEDPAATPCRLLVPLEKPPKFESTDDADRWMEGKE